MDEVRENPKAVVLGGWSPAYESIAHKNLVIDWCSDLSQMEGCNETDIFFAKILPGLSSGKFKKVLVSSESFSKTFPGLEWLPCTVDVKSVVAKDPLKFPGKNFGLFTYPHHRKNVVTQSIVAQAFGTLHCNSYFPKSYVRNFLKPGKYQSWDLPTKDILYNTMAGMDLGLCCFFTETFCYGAIEYILLGVPVLVSSLIPFAQDLGSDNICVANEITDPLYLHARIIMLFEDYNRKKITDKLLESVIPMLERHKKIATEVIGGL